MGTATVMDDRNGGAELRSNASMAEAPLSRHSRVKGFVWRKVSRDYPSSHLQWAEPMS